MTGLVRKAMLLAVLGLLAASAAFAGVPYCPNSTFPAYVDLGACTLGGAPDPNLPVSVTVRDVGNFPVANQLVSIQFSSDVALYGGVCCVEATTGLDGVATFHIAGGGRNANGTALYTGANAARIFFGSCATTGWCVTANVCTYNENGGLANNGIEVTDLAAWAADYNARLSGPFRPRSDFTHSGALDVVDLSFWARAFNSSKTACAGGLSVCPAF